MSNENPETTNSSQSEDLVPKLKLVLKTQTFPDQKLSVDPDLFVRDLKMQITELYACKPPPGDQKLIHAGMLLHNDQRLRSVIRKIDFEQEYSLHLVYNQKCSPVFTRKKLAEAARNETSGESSGRVEGSSQGQTQQVNQQTISNVTRLMANANMVVMRAKCTPAQYGDILQSMYAQHRAAFDSLKAAGGGAGSPPPSVPAPFVPPSFLNTLSGNAEPSPDVSSSSSASSGAPSHSSSANAEQSAREGDDSPQPAAAAAQPADIQPPLPPIGPGNPVMNAGGFGAAGPADDEEVGEDGDWLGYLYSGSRFVVLLAIVYFYSSLSRFLVVMLFAVLMAMLQRRWLPFFNQEMLFNGHGGLNLGRANNNNNEVPAPNDALRIQNDRNAEEPVQHNDHAPQPEANQDIPRSPAPPSDSAQTAEPRRLSVLETIFVAITTFFVSLLPVEVR